VTLLEQLQKSVLQTPKLSPSTPKSVTERDSLRSVAHLLETVTESDSLRSAAMLDETNIGGSQRASFTSGLDLPLLENFIEFL